MHTNSSDNHQKQTNMALKAGIVGLPNVGKSTLFNCLSSAKAQSANYPFCTIDAQQGQISVPDERLNKLAELGKKKEVEAPAQEPAPPAPSAEEVLLTEIRDLLKNK